MKTIYTLTVHTTKTTVESSDIMGLTHLCHEGDKAEIKSSHDFNGVFRGPGLGQLMATYDGKDWTHYY